MALDLLAHGCPRCAAAVRPGAPWCSQCYLDLRPAPGPALTSTPAASTPAASTPDAGASWPCAGCGARVAFGVDACADCGQGFLAGLRDPGPRLVLPLVGDLARLSRRQLAGLTAALVTVLVLLAAAAALVSG